MITPLPTPPSTADSANFNVRANAFLGALPVFVEEINSSFPISFTINNASTYSVQDSDSIIIQTTISSTFVLPVAADSTGRKIYILSKVAGGVSSSLSNVVTISATTPSTTIVTGVGKYVVLCSNGSYWYSIIEN